MKHVGTLPWRRKFETTTNALENMLLLKNILIFVWLLRFTIVLLCKTAYEDTQTVLFPHVCLGQFLGFASFIDSKRHRAFHHTCAQQQKLRPPQGKIRLLRISTTAQDAGKVCLMLPAAIFLDSVQAELDSRLGVGIHIWQKEMVFSGVFRKPMVSQSCSRIEKFPKYSQESKDVYVFPRNQLFSQLFPGIPWVLSFPRKRMVSQSGPGNTEFLSPPKEANGFSILPKMQWVF